MLSAAIRDAAGIPGVTVETTWDNRLGDPPPGARVAHSVTQGGPEGSEFQIFSRLAAECDRTWIIAPEFQGLLTDRCRRVELLGGTLVGPGSAATEICSDKLRLAAVLEENAIPTIPTHHFCRDQASPSELAFPCVVKPRDGAGSQDMWLVRSESEFHRLLPELWRAELLASAIWQPHVPGRSLSVGVLIQEATSSYLPLPVAQQNLGDDGRYVYRGGEILMDRALDAVAEAAVNACRLVPGLRGYVGVDLILPSDGVPRVVEINPRLTTSYLGYRRATPENLVERILFPGRFREPPVWGTRAVAFDAVGNSVPFRNHPYVEEPATNDRAAKDTPEA